jgi:vacuolar-type H+-ATPase catalytic subunit A/Vma1
MEEAVRDTSTCMAVTMAEYYRDMGYHVFFLAGSLIR